LQRSGEMNDKRKTKRQLVAELTALRARIAQLEESREEAGTRRVAMREGRRHFRGILPGLHDTAVLVVDRKGNVVSRWGAEGVIAHYGVRTTDDVRGKGEAAELPGQTGRIFAGAERVFETGESEQEAYLLRVPDGTFRHEITFSPLWDRSGEVSAVATVIRDVTAPRPGAARARRPASGYHVLAEEAPAVTYIAALDAAGSILYVSPQIEDYLGYTPEQYNADPRTWRKRLHTEDAQRVLFELSRCHATGDPFVCEYRMVRRDGEVVWFRDEGTIVRDDFGKPLFRQGVMVDITERRQAEQVLLVSHRFLEITNRHAELSRLLHEFVILVRNFTDCASVGVRILDEEGNIPYHACLGFSRHFYELASDKCVNSECCLCARVIRGDTDPALPFFTEGGSFYVNDATTFLETISDEQKAQVCTLCHEFGYESVALIPIWLGDRVLGLIHIADERMDVVPLRLIKVVEEAAIQLGTAIQRARVEEALRESEAKYRLLVENAGQPIFTLSPEGVFLMMNGNAAESMGGKPEDFIGKTLWDLFPKDIADKEMDDVREAVEADRLHVAERMLVLQGARRWFRIYLQPIKDAEGKLSSVQVIAYDITDRKQAEHELLAYQKQLRSLASELSLTEERERRRIAAGLHDHVGQLLTITGMKLEALAESTSKSDFAAGLAEVRGHIDEALRATKSLTFELSPPTLYELGLGQALEWFGEQIQEEHGIRVQVEDNGDPTPLEEDILVLLFRATRELLLNVVKHAKATVAEVSIHKDGRTMRISVQDDGVGFDTSAQRPLLRKNGGFGLFNVRERLDHLGGRLEIESAPGQGTRAVLFVPLSRQTTETSWEGA